MNHLLGIMDLIPYLSLTPGEEEEAKHISVSGYFQHEYINRYESFNHKGFTITHSGGIYLFDKTTPWTFAENSIIKKVSLLRNINASLKSEKLISLDELEVYYKLSVNIVNEKLSDPVLKSNQRGITIRKVIIPIVDNSSNFREILLTQSGDIERCNRAPATEIITDWLNKIKEELFR
jgi:hypothetical protein